MSGDPTFERLRSVFLGACGKAPEQRRAYLDSVCANDPALLAEVESLLQFDANEGALLRRPFLVSSSDSNRLAGEAGAPTGPNRSSGLGGLEGVLGQPPAERIGKYRVLECIGRGGMGIVYRAEQENPRRTVALKMLWPGRLSARQSQRFELEAQILGRLSHAGIAQIFEAGYEDLHDQKTPFFAMELVEGAPLTTYSESRQLDLRCRLELLSRICDAVHYAHQKGVIHRDLKPANILVDAQGQPKILDFGVARATDSDLELTAVTTGAGQVMGTLPYMSPEQISGDPLDLDTRSDVYALGVILYELLSDRLPYELNRKAIPEAMRTIREEEPFPLRLATGLGARRSREQLRDLQTIVNKSLEKESSRRYESAAELAAEIRRYLHDQPILARPATASYRFRKFAQRHKGMVVGCAATLVTLLSGFLVSLFLYLQAERARSAESEQRRLVERREEETRKVANFHADLLARVNVQAMGQGLVRTLREQAQAGLERTYVGQSPNRRKRSSDEVAAALAAFDEAVGYANTADIGQQLVDAYVLRPAAATIQQQFKDQPATEAAIRSAIGNEYRDLALYDDAETHMRAAVEIQSRMHGGDEHVELARSLNGLADLLMRKGEYVEAEALYGQSLAISRRVLGHEHPEVATVLTNLGFLLREKGDRVAAEPLIREALAMRRKLLGDEHPDMAYSLNELALLLQETGRAEQAEPLYRAALLHRKLLGDDHQEVTKTLNNLATLLLDRGDYAGAESLLREGLALKRSRLGDDHPEVAAMLNNLAAVLKARGIHDEAELLYREALAVTRRLLGDKHPDVAKVLNNLAVLLLARRKMDEAEPLFREVLVIRQAVLPPGHASTAATQIGLGITLVRQGRHSDAEPLLLGARDALRADPDSPDRFVGAALDGLVELYEAWHAAEPDAGSAAKADEWRRERTRWQATTRPAGEP